MASSRCNPVVASVSASLLFVVVGGARLVGGLVDIEEPLPTELLEYDPGDGGWRREQCAPLPLELGTGCCLSSALVAGRFLFVCSTTTVSAFDLSGGAWTAPRELRPAQGQLAAAFLASGRGGRRLLLAGRLIEEEAAFGVWDVDPRTLTVASKIGEMPPELLASMAEGTLRCVGEDGVLYVITDDQHRAYPACVCEVTGDLACSWTKLPPLPVAGSSALGRFHKMLAFTSPVL